jgi:hypothetical protein
MTATDLLQRCLDEIDCDVYSDPVTIELVQDIRNYLRSWYNMPFDKKMLLARRVSLMLDTPQCDHSGKQDGGYSLGYRDGGRCDWCGEHA